MTKSGTVTTGDGIRLSYDQWGDQSKPNVVLIPGWCQTALQWKKQYEDLSEDFHITTYDHRGHGESEQTTRGFRVSRLSADLNDLLVQLDLKNVTLVGHSMGCSIIWSHWDLFTDSRSRIKSLVLVDQSPCMLPRPEWSEETSRMIGTVFTDESLNGFASALTTPDAEAVLSGFIPSMFTKAFSPEDVKWTIERNLLMDSKNAATLLLDHGKNDWRDVIETIDVPTLVVAATASICPLPGLEWIAEHIKGSKLVVFDEQEGGSHFMFYENPTKFNEVVRRFVETSGAGELA